MWRSGIASRAWSSSTALPRSSTWRSRRFSTTSDLRERPAAEDLERWPKRRLRSRPIGKALAESEKEGVSMQLQSLQDLFEHEISDLYSAEQQLVGALPKLAQAASNKELREAFEHHLQETRDHVRRLEDVRGQIGSSKSDECEGMRGL